MTEEDKQRFVAVYDRHFRPVLRYALARVGPEQARDVVAETFLIAWRRFSELPAEPAAWLFGIARKVIAGQLRTSARQGALKVRLAGTGSGIPGPADPADQAAERDSALIALSQLGQQDGGADTAGWQAVAHGALTKGFIYYDSKTWTLYSSTAGPTWSRVARTPTAELEANLLRYALDGGRWAVTGHAVVGGQQAIVIRVSESMPARPVRAPAGTRGARPPAVVPAGPMIDVAPFLTPGQYARARAHGQTTFTPTGTSTTTLYISAKTYLPIRQTVTTHLTSQGVPDSAADQTESSTFQWLPVTRANLALLQPPAVPAGFTTVNPAGQ